MESKFSWKSFISGIVLTCMVISPHRALECAVSQGVSTYRNIAQSFEPPIDGHTVQMAARIASFEKELDELEEIDSKKSRNGKN